MGESMPSWWADGVRVVNGAGLTGTVSRAGDGWVIGLDKAIGEAAVTYIAQPDFSLWSPEVRQLVTRSQRDRILHDSERALLRGFGCHYVPEWEALPERIRVGGGARPNAVGRPELDGLRAVIRGAIEAAIAPYVTGG